MAQQSVFADVLELAGILRPAWKEMSDSIPSWHLRCEGDTDGDEAADDDANAAEEGASEKDNVTDDATDGDGGDSGSDKPKEKELDWKSLARRHEREGKRARKALEDAQQKIKEREDAERSEHEKAIENAQKQTREELQSEFDKERRKDRLELETTKIAARGLKVGSGDEAKTVRFADPDDALVHLERDIRNGDIDTEELFDEQNRVRSGQLEEALTDLLSRKPHLAATDGKPPPKVQGSADGGKGEPGDAEPSVDAEFKRIRRNQGAQQAQSVLVGRRAG